VVAGADAPLERSLHDEARGCVLVRAAHRVQHLVERHVAHRHAVGVDQHLKLAQVAAEPLDRRDARHRQEPVSYLELGEVAQGHEIDRAGLRLERDLDHLVQPSGDARQERRAAARRQLRRNLRHALGHELARAVVVGVGLELDRHLRDAELVRRAHAARLRKTCERALERDRDRGLQLLGAHRRVLHDDVEHGCGQVREHVAAQVLERRDAERGGRRREQHDQPRPREREADDALEHGRLSARGGRRRHRAPSRPRP
jgi:hypothetical protein